MPSDGTPTPSADTAFTGRCYCGAVSLHSDTPPLTVAYCHCSDCRRWAGAPVAAFAAFRAADLSATPNQGPRVSHTAGQPYVGATLAMYPAPDSHGGMGNFIAWDNINGEIKWSNPEQFSVWSGSLTTAGGITFYGTLEGYLKAVKTETGEELFRFKTPSGIIGNVMTYEQGGKQYIGILSGIGGWAGIGLAAGLTNPNDGLGAVGGYAALSDYTALGGQLTVFALPN